MAFEEEHLLGSPIAIDTEDVNENSGGNLAAVFGCGILNQFIACCGL